MSRRREGTVAEQWTYDGPGWIYLQPVEGADDDRREWYEEPINLPADYRQDQTEPTDCPYVRGDIHDAVVLKLAERDREDTLSRIQKEQRAWVLHNFGEREAWQPLLGIQEEVGELAHAFLKRHQGIRGTHEEHTADIRDAVADIIIFLMDFASAEGIDVREVLDETWQKVRQRDWKANPSGTPAPTAGEEKTDG
jgi:NTP pyrophosphatase (non-canonical NTP hydrolase)